MFTLIINSSVEIRPRLGTKVSEKLLFTAQLPKCLNCYDNILEQPGPASSAEERLICKFLSLSDCGSKLTVHQVFFKQGKI